MTAHTTDFLRPVENDSDQPNKEFIDLLIQWQ